MNRAEQMTFPWALLLGLLAAGCGPSSEEIGASVLTAAPVVLIASSALLWTIWRPLEGAGAQYPWLILWRASLISLVGPAVGVPVLVRTGDAETPVLALVTYGTAILAITIIVWHVLRLAKVPRPVERALLGVYLVLTLPAFLFLLDDAATEHIYFGVLAVWIYAGWLGSVPALFMILTWIGTAIRNAKRRRPSSA
ncbi:MAG: hypothetical protein IV100_04045 [Myxococcales bacterium]|nr:hypothetical protein [Myxococcales bacterium]